MAPRKSGSIAPTGFLGVDALKLVLVVLHPGYQTDAAARWVGVVTSPFADADETCHALVGMTIGPACVIDGVSVIVLVDEANHRLRLTATAGAVEGPLVLALFDCDDAAHSLLDDSIMPATAARAASGVAPCHGTGYEIGMGIAKWIPMRSAKRIAEREWGDARPRWSTIGEVFLAEAGEGVITGHTIVRLDDDGFGNPIGLFSTAFVAREHRRAGIARKLLDRGERWMLAHGRNRAVTYTDEANKRLQRLFIGQGYSMAPMPRNFVALSKELG